MDALTAAAITREQVEDFMFLEAEMLDEWRLKEWLGLFTADECRQSFAEAEQLHVESAPRYDSLQVCEEQHGVGNCGSEDQQVSNGGSGSIFMPLLAGYLIGSMLGGAGMSRSQPMYRTPQGGYTNAARTSWVFR